MQYEMLYKEQNDKVEIYTSYKDRVHHNLRSSNLINQLFCHGKAAESALECQNYLP